jgi:hypothetical protein
MIIVEPTINQIPTAHLPNKALQQTGAALRQVKVHRSLSGDGVLRVCCTM